MTTTAEPKQRRAAAISRAECPLSPAVALPAPLARCKARDMQAQHEGGLTVQSGHAEEVLRDAMAAAMDYVASIDERRVGADPAALAALEGFDEPFPEHGADGRETLRTLHELGSPATVASTGSRYFGFVIGATLPVALGSSWLVSSWDQNAALPVASPVAAKLHDVVSGWLVDVLHLPEETGVAFVSGATVANASCLAAARDSLLAGLGWDAQADGLFGAPPLSVVVGERAHSTLSKSLGLVGLGRNRLTVVPADDQGRMRADLLPDLDGPVLVCAQAGEVNSGAFDPFDEIADWLAERSGWLHVDGAFGLWALADPGRADLVRGLDRADSWATDGHKWLNVTYDCGIAFVRRLADLRRTFAAMAGYLPTSGEFEAMHHTPQSSQRRPPGRGVVRPAHAGPGGSGRARDPGLRRRRGDRRAAGGGRADHPERRRPQPGARPPGRRADDGGADRRGPSRRPHLVRPDPVGWGDGDADQRVVLEDRSRRCRGRGRRHPRLRGAGAGPRLRCPRRISPLGGR